MGRSHKQTFAFVGVPGGGAAPGSVEVEGLAALAVAAGGVVAAVAGQLLGARARRLALLHGHAARRVAVALAAPADREVRHGVVLGARSALRRAVRLVALAHHVQAVEHHAHVRGRHPVLQHGGHVEVGRARTPFQRAEGESSSAGVLATQSVGIGASRFLLVSGSHSRLIRTPVHPPALARVKLKRLPCQAIIYTLVNRDRIRSRRFRAELEADVGELVLLAEGEREGDVVGRGVVARGRQRGGAPAGDVVRVVEVGEQRGRVAAVGARGVAHAARGVGRLGARRVAQPLGPVAPAHGRRHHGGSEGGVHEVGDAALGAAVLVARVRGRGQGQRRGGGQERHGAEGGHVHSRHSR